MVKKGLGLFTIILIILIGFSFIAGSGVVKNNVDETMPQYQVTYSR